MNAAIKIVASAGFEGFTTKKWAQVAGVAEGSLYYHFKSKDDLLAQTFYYIDHRIAAVFDEFVKHASVNKKNLNELVHDMWKQYFGFLMKNPEETLFYYRFRTSTRYNKEIQETQFTYFHSFISIITKLDQMADIYKRISWHVLWTYVIDTSTAFAFRVITGGISSSAQTEEMMISLFENGVLGILKMPECTDGKAPYTEK